MVLPVIVPGRTGSIGCASITTFDVAADVHSAKVLTVKLYVPVFKFVMVVLALEPMIAPGLIVQLSSGRPLKTTLPVADTQVGCVMVPTMGTDGGIHTGVKVAVTVLFPFIVIDAGLTVPVRPPLQPENDQPASAFAVN